MSYTDLSGYWPTSGESCGENCNKFTPIDGWGSSGGGLWGISYAGGTNGYGTALPTGMTAEEFYRAWYGDVLEKELEAFRNQTLARIRERLSREDDNQEQKGAVKYNRPPPNTVPVEGMTKEALQCFVNVCLPGKTLSVTGGQEKYDENGRLLHSTHSTHYPENGASAVDISTWREDNYRLTTEMVNECALGCGFTRGQLETGHWHLQIGPGNGSLLLPMDE